MILLGVIVLFLVSPLVKAFLFAGIPKLLQMLFGSIESGLGIIVVAVALAFM